MTKLPTQVPPRQRTVQAVALLGLVIGGIVLASASAPAFASPTVSGTSAGTLLVPASISPIAVSPGSGLVDAVVAPDSSTVYLTDSTGNRVLAFNASTGTSTPTAVIGSQPKGIAISPSGNVVYVADYSTGIVELIDTSTNTLLPGHITLGASSLPLHMAVSPDGSRLYVAEQSPDLLEAYSTTAPYPFLGAATTGIAPTGVAISADGTKVYVAGGGGVSEGYVDVVDTTALNTTTSISPTVIPIPPAAVPFAGTFDVAVSPDGSTLYVVNISAFTLQTIPTSTDVPGPTISLPDAPNSIAVSADGKWVYISDLLGEIDVASTSDLSNFASFSDPGVPEAVAISSDGKRVYTPNAGVAPTLGAFNIAKLTVSGPGQIAPGAATTDFAVSIDDGNATVGDYSGDIVSVDVLDSANTVAAAVAATLTLDPTTGALTASVPTANLAAGTYSIRATLTDPVSKGKIVAIAAGFEVGSGVALAATGVNVALPLTLGGALLIGGAAILRVSRRRPRLA